MKRSLPMLLSRHLRVLLPALLLLPALAAAATLRIGVLSLANDERLDPRRAELAYPGQPGGPAVQAVEVAVKESAFELDAAKLIVKVEAIEARDLNDAKAQLQRFEKSGVQAVVVDLPADWLAAAAGTVKLSILNAGSEADSLRGAACQANLFHALPSDRMRADAVAQALVARKWQRVLVLHGAPAADTARLAVVNASIKRYGLKPVAVKPFKLSADPRERDLANPLLLTGGADYDVVWVVDGDGEFARSLPYRTALPRPVVGDAGLSALAWAPHFERFGAPQLARRFAREAKRPMTAPDWAAWLATKAVLQAGLATAANPTPELLRKAMLAADFTLDGFKGVRLSWRPWDRQLRQPLLLTDGVGVIGLAPVEGVLHPKNNLDTLGVDERETACKAQVSKSP